jgi:hypothetical protein
MAGLADHERDGAAMKLLNPFILALLYVALLVAGANPWVVLVLVVAGGILNEQRKISHD